MALVNSRLEFGEISAFKSTMGPAPASRSADRFEQDNQLIWEAESEASSSGRSCKLLKEMVARDGIEPPTPAFSGLRSTS
jgi:hypothetical protein